MNQDPETPKSPEESFRDDREGVVPLDSSRAGRVAPRAPRSALQRASNETPRFRMSRDEGWAEAIREGEPDEVLALLGRDDVRIASELDLHGRGTGPAVVAVERFVREQARRGMRTVRIVTGKGIHSEGAPVVRDAVVDALTAGPIAWLVLALRTAPSSHGGSGALLVTVRPEGR